MTKYKENIEKIISDRSIDLEQISFEVCKGIEDGVWSGMKKGARKGFKEGLKGISSSLNIGIPTVEQ